MIEYYQKVADLWPRYGEIDSTIVHQAIVVSLINLEMTSVCLGTYPPERLSMLAGDEADSGLPRV